MKPGRQSIFRKGVYCRIHFWGRKIARPVWGSQCSTIFWSFLFGLATQIRRGIFATNGCREWSRGLVPFLWAIKNLLAGTKICFLRLVKFWIRGTAIRGEHSPPEKCLFPSFELHVSIFPVTIPCTYSPRVGWPYENMQNIVFQKNKYPNVAGR